MLRIYVMLAVMAMVAGIGWKWNQMENTIAKQRVELVNKDVAIQVMADNAVVAEKVNEKMIKKVVFDAIAAERKATVEGSINYDNSTSVDINSTRFYY